MSDKRLFSMQADTDLLASFKAVCDSNDETQSQVVRKLMRQYIDKNKQLDMFTKSKKS